MGNNKTVVELKCFCGYMIPLTQKIIDTSEEQECPSCGYETMYCPPTIEEILKQNEETETPSMDATHVRIMARGEDGHEWCLKNGFPKDSDVFDLVIAGAKACYPEATVWVEDEESTIPTHTRYHRSDLDLY